MLALAVAWAGCGGGEEGPFRIRRAKPTPTPTPAGFAVFDNQGAYVADFNDPAGAFGFVTEFQTPITTGAVAAHRTLNSADIFGPNGLCFDKNENLWVVNFDSALADGDNSGQIDEFTLAQLKALVTNSTPAATVIISDNENSVTEDLQDVLDGPEGCVFDPTQAAGSQNLWVGVEESKVEKSGEEGEVEEGEVVEESKVVVEYTPAQQVTGSPDPNIVLVPKTFSFSKPSIVAFDTSGDLIVVDEDFKTSVDSDVGQVNVYTKAQLGGLTPGLNTVDPDFCFTSASFVADLEGAALDAGGTLWITDNGNDKVFQFPMSALSTACGTGGATTAVTPAVTLTSATVGGVAPCTKSLEEPYGIAFFSSTGALAVSNQGFEEAGCTGSTSYFLKTLIGTTGSPTPTIFVTNNAGETNLANSKGIAIGPPLP